jgi:phage terminase large subunit-like protein
MDLLRDISLRSFTYFAKLILHQKVGKMHEEWIDALNGDKHICIISPRGHFKTSIMSVSYPLWIMFRESSYKTILIVSATREQAGEILGLIKRQIEDNPILREVLYPDNIYTTKWSETQIRTKNGHRVISMPLNDSIRGKHSDITICDDILQAEVSTDVEDAKRIFYGTVFPTTVAKRGKHIVVGTPIAFTDLLNDLSSRPTFMTLKYPAVICDIHDNWLRPVFPEHFSLPQLREIYNTQPRHLWAREYMCEPLSDESSMFPTNLIRKARQVHDSILPIYEEEKHSRLRVIGCDVAVGEGARSDWSVFTILEKIEGYPVLIRDIVRNHFNTEENLKELQRLQGIYNPSAVLVEKTGVGWAVAESAEKDDLLRGVAMSFDTKRKSKERILSRLEVMLRNNFVPGKENESLTLPDHDILLSELSTFGYRKDPRTGIVSYASLGAHDDCVMSLSIALEALENSKPVTLTLV